jgi:hypothetical protein
MNSHSAHLSEDQLIRLVIDESDLSFASQNHYRTCSYCQRLKIDIDQRLSHLAAAARAHAPHTRHPIGLPSKKTLHPFRLAFAAGLAIFLITIALWQVMPSRESQAPMLTEMAADTDFTQPFLADVATVEENGLTDLYLSISGETNSYFGDEFIEFVHPVSHDFNSA